MLSGLSWRSGLPIIISAGVITAVFFVDPIAQDPAYHLFVDQRAALSIPNFQNVMSNLPFAVVGLGGLFLVLSNLNIVNKEARPAWLVFFVGISVTALGSGYYHLSPDNETLIWDRLPMTIAFMSFVAVVIGEYVSARAGRTLLLPLLLAGAASVFYWAHTEALGRGDLRAYAIVQFLPMLLVPLIILFYRGRSDLGGYVAYMIAFYFVAKVLEFHDVEIYQAGGLTSGHTLKHLAASMAPASLLYGLMRRRYHAPRQKDLTD